MENYQLSVSAYDRPGSLERILRVIRHRGGKIETMNMQSETLQRLSLNFNIANARPKEQMCNQLRKLLDVLSVN